MEPAPGSLAAFLRAARAKVRPEHVGLISGARRRVPGLRRDEVAELVGISSVWYTRFESGRARLSVAAIARVADVLQLDPIDRRALLCLARPDIAAIDDRGFLEHTTGLGAGFARIRDFARASHSATSIEELAAHGSRTIRDVIGGTSVSYVRCYEPAARALTCIAATGPGDAALIGDAQPCDGVSYAMRSFVDGDPFFEADLQLSACEQLRARGERVGVRSYYSQPIMGASGLAAVVGIASPDCGLPAAWQIAVLEATAAICELAAERVPSGRP